MLLALLLAFSIPKPAPVDVVLITVSELAILADLSTTLDIKNHPGSYETNPLLGKHPSDARILVTGGLTMLAIGAVWGVLPNEYRRLVSVGVISCEVPVIMRNLRSGVGFTVPW